MPGISQHPAADVYNARVRLHKHNLRSAEDRTEFKSNHEITQQAYKIADQEYLSGEAASKTSGGKLDAIA